MSSVIQLKRSANAGFTPAANTLANGELFINYADGIIYCKNANGVIMSLSMGTSDPSRTIFTLASNIWGGDPTTVYGGVLGLDGGSPMTNYTGQQSLDASANRIGI